MEDVYIVEVVRSSIGRRGKGLAGLIAMCCGGGLGTGTIIERV